MRYGLWKSVENAWVIGSAGASAIGPHQPANYSGAEVSKPSQKACSSCAGDYEDPDQTAWTPEGEENEERLRDATRDQSLAWLEEEGEGNDEFPAVEE